MGNDKASRQGNLFHGMMQGVHGRRVKPPVTRSTMLMVNGLCTWKGSFPCMSTYSFNCIPKECCAPSCFSRRNATMLGTHAFTAWIFRVFRVVRGSKNALSKHLEKALPPVESFPCDYRSKLREPDGLIEQLSFSWYLTPSEMDKALV